MSPRSLWVLVLASVAQADISTGEPTLGNQDPRLIRQTVAKHRGELVRCADQHPTVAGKLAVRFHIGARGAVSRIELAESTVGNRKLEACVVRQVASWVFPKMLVDDVVVVLPFVFQPKAALPSDAGAAVP